MDKKRTVDGEIDHLSMMSWRKQNNIFYIHMSKPDQVVHVNDFGLEMVGKSCGLMRIFGRVKLKDNFENLSVNQKRLFLCSDLVLPESILSGGVELPVLCELMLQEKEDNIFLEPSNPLWLNVNENLLTDIRLFIRNGDNQTPSVEECFLNCTLLVYKPSRK